MGLVITVDANSNRIYGLVVRMLTFCFPIAFPICESVFWMTNFTNFLLRGIKNHQKTALKISVHIRHTNEKSVKLLVYKTKSPKIEKICKKRLANLWEKETLHCKVARLILLWKSGY